MTIAKSKWIKVNNDDAPTGVRLLVVKHYLDQDFDFGIGGYRGPSFKTPSFITVDISFREGSWENGGVVTHYMELPEMPE